MRVTFGSKYNQIQNSQSSLQSRLNHLNAQIASGKKIQQGYENSNIYEKDLQLGYQEATLSQGIDVAQNAYNTTISTDKTLAELSKAISEFNTKLLQVANQPQSSTSRAAIANELSVLKEHIKNIANTSIGGNYLFSGTKTKTPPISPNGNYMGNNQKLEALVGSNVKIPYNIPGSDLFFGSDSDSLASTTSNIKKYNLSKLYPNIMDKLNKDQPSQEVFIKSTDTLRDLIGDDDDDPSNDGKVFFYLQGIRPDGTRFKSKFDLDKNYINLENSTKVSDLLDKIGREFGNNQATKIVDVQLNTWGEIEIKSLVPGSSNLSFHLLASDMDTNNINTLIEKGARITSFQKSPFPSNHYTSSVIAIRDNFKQEQISLPISLLSQTTKTPATPNTFLSEIFDSEVVSIQFDGEFSIQNKDGEQIPQILEFSTKETKISDVLQDIQTFYKQNGFDVQTEIANGKIILTDQNAKKTQKATNLKLKLSTYEQNGKPTKGIPQDYHNTYDDVYFEKKGSKLLSNISQVLLSQKGYATDQNKISEVAGNLEGQTYQLKLKDLNGITLDAKLSFGSEGVYLFLPSRTPKTNSQPHKIPILNLDDQGNFHVAKPEDITYRQMMDGIGLALNFSNQEDKIYTELSKDPTHYTPKQKELYEKVLLQMQGKIEIGLNQNGQIEISDRIRATSKMEFSITNQESGNFSHDSIRNTQSGLLLHANNSLVIDKPQVNLFDSLDIAISAVREGIYRPDEYPNSFNANMRNIGIQNSLDVIQHLGDHVEKMIVLNGSYGKSFEHSIAKNEVLKTQVQTLRGENMGADIAETYNKFQNLSTNYNAVLNSSGKINKMSILDYV